MVTKINNYVLLPLIANWNRPVTLRLQWETEVAPSLRGNEQRGSFRSAPRATANFTWSTYSIEHQESFRELLAAGYQFTNGAPGANGDVGKFCAPLHGLASWVQALPAANQVTLYETVWPWAVGDWCLLVNAAFDWQVLQITAIAGSTITLEGDVTISLTDENAVYPLIYGRLEVGDISHDSPQHADVPISIISNAFPIPAATPWGNYRGRPILSVEPDVSNSAMRRRTYDLRQQQIGFGAESWEPQQQYVTAEYSLEYFLLPSETSDFLQFLVGIDGQRTGFWLPGLEEAGAITSVQSSTQFRIQNVDLTDSWNSEPCVDLFFRYADNTTEGARIQGVATVSDEEEQVTLTAALTGALDTETFARRLYYVRQNKSGVDIAFDGEGRATIKLQARELPFEYAEADLGERPVYLYHVWKTIGGATTDWYYTSHDVAATLLGTTYQPAPISHSSIEQSTTADRDDITVETFLLTGSPFADFIPFAPQVPYNLSITEMFLDSAIYGVLFTGVIRTVEMEGRKLTATASVRLTALNRHTPRYFLQKCCNLILYSAQCGVNASAFTVSGTVTVISGRVINISSAQVSGLGAGYFAWGRISVLAADGSREYRLVRNDAVIDASHRQLILQDSLSNASVGATISLEAGCDLRPATCANKFNNLVNFGGCCAMPASNPTLKAIRLSNPGGGKGGK